MRNKHYFELIEKRADTDFMQQEMSGYWSARRRAAATLCADQLVQCTGGDDHVVRRRRNSSNCRVPCLGLAAGVLRKPADEQKVRRVRVFGMLFLAVAALYLAIRLAGV